MSGKIASVNPYRAWLSEFFFVRGMLNGPAGKPLYSYQVTEVEYASLRDLLKDNLKHANYAAQNKLVGGCFCLFVSEQYRRNYNRSWSWSGAEDELGVAFTAVEHAMLTQNGLDYWQRPVRKRESGRDWLGSLFAEGGLPWPLVQDDSHGFGRAVRRGIREFYRTEGNRRTTADLMADFEEYLPLSFRTLETRQLLAGIVDQLMFLVEHYPLNDQQDPAGYLDQANPRWSGDFPIPLDEANARKLINEWLRDAGEKRHEYKEELARTKDFSCEHILQGFPPDWTVRTELRLPQTALFPFDPIQLSSTRFEISYYEGEYALAHAGAVYGQIVGENSMQIRFSSQQVTLERRRLSEPVTLRLMDNGRVIHRIHFDGSILDCQEAPLVFEHCDDRWMLAGTSSCSLRGGRALIRLPAGLSLSAEQEGVIYTNDRLGGRWVEVKSDVSLQSNDDCYHIELNREAIDALKPTLSGTLAPFDSNPAIVYLGWPSLELPDGFSYGRDELVEYANGQPFDQIKRSGFFGLVRYTLRSNDGKTLLQRRFAVLPKKFGLTLLPSVGERPATVQLKNAEHLTSQIVSETLKVKPISEEEGGGFYLQDDGLKPPASFIIELWNKASSQTVRLHLPYPYQGARLLDENDQPTLNRELTLAGIIGHRIVLTSGGTHGQTFTLELELKCAARPQPKRTYEIRVESSPVLVSLHSFQNDMLQILGAVDEQDVFIRLQVGNQLKINIRRYNGRVNWEEEGVFTVREVRGQQILDAVHAEAMLLSDPKQEALVLSQRTTQGVGTGVFEVLNTMRRSGPWLIYPSKESEIQFRPSLYDVDSQNPDIVNEVCSLHRAAELFHPVRNPDVINQQINAMAEDFNHSGWQYLADLKKHYSHLLLSCFESWRALSRHPRALAFAVLRLEMDEAYCNRVRDELAVIWEATPLRLWAEVYQYYLRSLHEVGFPQALISKLEQNRASVLRTVVSGFDYVGDYLHTGNCATLTKVQPEAILPIWCSQLRQMHDADHSWPTDIGMALGSWISKQELPMQVKSLSQVGFANAVVYLPIFMAFVTAEKAKLSDLDVPLPYLKFAIRLVADFDRQSWFNPVHALMVSYLMAPQSGE